MNHIRQARREDAERIAEIYVFNYRLNFYPIFRDDNFYFKELTVSALAAEFADMLDSVWLYDDGAVKGFVQVEGQEIRKLFVEPALQGNSIGSELLQFAVTQMGAGVLWALEKNAGAIRFYTRAGFTLTGERKPEADTDVYLVRMAL